MSNKMFGTRFKKIMSQEEFSGFNLVHQSEVKEDFSGEQGLLGAEVDVTVTIGIEYDSNPKNHYERVRALHDHFITWCMSQRRGADPFFHGQNFGSRQEPKE